MSDYEPLILALCCHYCAYAAADLAGSMRLQYPANVRVLRYPCTGKVEQNDILTAFEGGVDGVLVAGCLEGGCHFLEGNLRARRVPIRQQGNMYDRRTAGVRSLRSAGSWWLVVDGVPAFTHDTGYAVGGCPFRSARS